MANLGQYAQANRADQLGSMTGAQIGYRPPAPGMSPAAGAPSPAQNERAAFYQAAQAGTPTVTTSGFGASQPAPNYGAKSGAAGQMGGRWDTPRASGLLPGNTPAQAYPNQTGTYQAAPSMNGWGRDRSAYQQQAMQPRAPTVTTSGFGAAQPGQSYGSKFPATPQYTAAQAQPAPGYAQALQSLLNARRPQGMAQQGFAPSAYGGNGNAANEMQMNAMLQQQLAAQRGY